MHVVEEKTATLFEAMNEKVKDLEESVERIEGTQATMSKKIDTIIRALHTVEAKTNDSSYITKVSRRRVVSYFIVAHARYFRFAYLQFVETQYQQMREELKKEVAKELHAQQEKSITSLEVNRHIDHSRLEGKITQVGDRLGKLEQTVVAEQQNSVQVLEAILSSTGAK